jgi:hypothetical protein
MGISVVGGFSKLLKQFRSKHSGKIISFSDCMWSWGDVYRVNGFRLSHYDEPSYYYVSPCYNFRYHHSQFKKPKNLPPDDKRTEEEIRFDDGYHKIFNAGLYAWILD